MSITPSQPRGFASSPSLGQLAGGRRATVATSSSFFFLHRVANPCKNPRHDVSKPLHGCPSVATSKSQPENPRCRSNQPSLENLAKVLMR